MPKKRSGGSAPKKAVTGKPVSGNQRVVKAGDGKGNNFGWTENSKGRLRGGGDVNVTRDPSGAAKKPMGKMRRR